MYLNNINLHVNDYFWIVVKYALIKFWIFLAYFSVTKVNLKVGGVLDFGHF